MELYNQSPIPSQLWLTKSTPFQHSIKLIIGTSPIVYVHGVKGQGGWEGEKEREGEGENEGERGEREGGV